MPYSNWLRKFAIIGLVLLPLQGHSQQNSQHQENAPESNQHQTDDFVAPLRVEIVESQPDADARKSAENESANREIEDLIAQKGMNTATQAMNEATQRMARDTERMANDNWLMMIATFIGVALLSATLVLTLQTNYAAVSAAKAAHKFGEREFAPYAAVENAQVSFDDTACYVSIVVKNHGRGIARQVQVEGSVKVAIRNPLAYETLKSVRGNKQVSPIPKLHNFIEVPFSGSAGEILPNESASVSTIINHMKFGELFEGASFNKGNLEIATSVNWQQNEKNLPSTTAAILARAVGVDQATLFEARSENLLTVVIRPSARGDKEA